MSAVVNILTTFLDFAGRCRLFDALSGRHPLPQNSSSLCLNHWHIPRTSTIDLTSGDRRWHQPNNFICEARALAQIFDLSMILRPVEGSDFHFFFQKIFSLTQEFEKKQKGAVSQSKSWQNYGTETQSANVPLVSSVPNIVPNDLCGRHQAQSKCFNHSPAAKGAARVVNYAEWSWFSNNLLNNHSSSLI